MIAWILIAALPLFTLAMALLNTATWRRGKASFRAGESISVLIPARNEERNIQGAVQSVLDCKANAAVVEVLVYDDGSTDATASIVQQMSQKDQRVKLIPGVTLPQGWIGKPHACHRLASIAKGELLLFIDADVRLKQNGLNRLLSLRSVPARGRIVSAVPHQISGSLFECLVIPMLLLTYLAWLPLRLIEWGRNPHTVAANGQLLLLAWSEYQALGGFSAVKNEIVDDVAFCRHAKKNGYRVVFADGFHMASCRMYEGAKATTEGFAKNLFEGVGSTGGLLLVCALYVSAFLIPYLALVPALGAATSTVNLTNSSLLMGAMLRPALVGVFCVISLRVLLAARFGQPWSGVFFHPLSIVSFLFIATVSFWWQFRKVVSWRGRNYQPLALRRIERSLATPNSPRAAKILPRDLA